MSLKKKIIISFLISSITIVVFSIFFCINFVEIKKEIRYLELSDTIRSKSLQLRRHEKNFFLYGDLTEVKSVYRYIQDIKLIVKEAKHTYNGGNFLSNAADVEKTEKYRNNIEEYSGYTEKVKPILEQNRLVSNRGLLLGLENKIEEYSQRFNHIEILFWNFHREFARLKPSHPRYSAFFPLIESTILERPSVNAELLRGIFSLRPGDPAIEDLQELNAEISALRKNGEEMLTISKNIDTGARGKVEKALGLSQTAALILFPVFFVVGLGTLFAVSHSVVKRLKILTDAIKKAGKGDFSPLTIPTEQDEVSMLITSFNKMEGDLVDRDRELAKKNEELLQGRKLASIGTLASGVAHELNNPLNNIYLAAQVLSKEIGEQETCPSIVKETVKDIFSQTLRVKRIVSDLLEFAREKVPEFKKINIVSMIKDVFSYMAMLGDLFSIKYDIKAPEDIEILGDRHLLEQVFINLFSNAVDAMEGRGFLNIEINTVDASVQIKVSDTGKGILPKDLPRIFDPFFTTKEKGTGLGLAIVYSIIKKHNGKIEVDSELHKGATFTITLPG